jgi:hypothetical protein
MKKHLQIFILFFIIASNYGLAQNAYFEFGKSHVEMQTKVEGDSTLAFYYVVKYHAGSSGNAFNGYIRTDYITGKNSVPSKSIDSVNVANDVFGGQMNDGDTAKIYGHIRVNDIYFRNGNNNLIVIWPTGGKNGSRIYCSDSVTYFKNITISGLTGLASDKNDLNSIRIFPNPTSSYLNLQITDLSLKPRLLRILDISGKEVYNVQGNPGRIDVSSLKNGSYFLIVVCPDNRKAIYSFIIGK